MTVSPRCVSYYVVGLDTEGQEIYQGRGRCHECRVNPQVDISHSLHNTSNLHFSLLNIVSDIIRHCSAKVVLAGPSGQTQYQHR